MKTRAVTPPTVGNFVMRNGVYILCIALLIIPGFFSSSYLASASLTTLSKNVAVWGLMAVGVSFVMLLGCNDLSIGMNVSMLTVFTVLLANKYNIIVVIPIVLVCGILAGCFNGVIVGKFGMNPFIATLGTQMVFKGIGLIASGGSPVFSFNKTLSKAYDKVVLDIGFIRITLPFFIMIVTLMVASLVLKYTRLGQNIYVVGGNKEAAALSGISTVKTTIICYAISGFCAGITAIFVTALNSSGNGAVGERYSLQTVAACVLGGITMTGGRGNALRAVLGVCAMQLIQKVLYQADSSIANLQIGIIGLILVIFLLIDHFTTVKKK